MRLQWRYTISWEFAKTAQMIPARRRSMIALLTKDFAEQLVGGFHGVRVTGAERLDPGHAILRAAQITLPMQSISSSPQSGRSP
jgi:hypothetical protein